MINKTSFIFGNSYSCFICCEWSLLIWNYIWGIFLYLFQNDILVNSGFSKHCNRFLFNFRYRFSWFQDIILFVFFSTDRWKELLTWRSISISLIILKHKRSQLWISQIFNYRLILMSIHFIRWCLIVFVCFVLLYW